MVVISICHQIEGENEKWKAKSRHSFPNLGARQKLLDDPATSDRGRAVLHYLKQLGVSDRLLGLPVPHAVTHGPRVVSMLLDDQLLIPLFQGGSAFPDG